MHILTWFPENWECLQKLKVFIKWIHQNNGRESALNRALDGSTYHGLKLVSSSLWKKIVVRKWNNLYLGLVMSSSEWKSPIKIGTELKFWASKSFKKLNLIT
jgi:hypothetical protein